VTLGIHRAFDADPVQLARLSRAALAYEGEAEDEAVLCVARPRSSAVLLGAFGRAEDALPRDVPVHRRASGGPAVRIGEGSLWTLLLLPRVNALLSDCDEARIVNRHVRPFLRALTKTAALAHFFGRDWISVKHRPAAWIGFAHAHGTGRTVVEAVFACTTPFDVGPRASYLGKEPGTLASIAGRDVEPAALADAIARAWAEATGRAVVDRGALPDVGADDHAGVPADPPWAATVDEAIGVVGAGPDARGRFRVGGDFLVSTDALAELEAALPETADADVGARVDATLGAPGVALDGVRSLTSVRDVILAARRT
jgi:hypothetical protein